MKTLVGLLALGFLCLYQTSALADTITCTPRQAAGQYNCHADREPVYGAIAWTVDPGSGGSVASSNALSRWDEELLGPCPNECIPFDDAYAIYYCGNINNAPAFDGSTTYRSENVYATFVEMGGIKDATSVSCRSKTIYEQQQVAYSPVYYWDYDLSGLYCASQFGFNSCDSGAAWWDYFLSGSWGWGW